MLAAIANSWLVPLTVDLRNAGIAMLEMLRAFVVLVGVALLVVAGAKLDACSLHHRMQISGLSM